MNNKGIALVITLLVLTLLLTMILEFSMDMRVEARAAANFRDEMQAYYLAKSGVTFAIAILEEDSKEEPTYDSLNELWAQKLPPVPVGSGTVTVAITDEDSKININKLDKGFGTVTAPDMRKIMYNFLKQFELQERLKEEIPDAIADFIDENNDEISFNSAESSYYEGLEDHYPAKNKHLDSLQELRMIKGIDSDLFNKLKKFITINSDGLININTASKEALLSLSDDLTGDVVDEIIAYRGENPFKTKAELRALIPDQNVYINISKYIEVKSNYYSIKATGNVNNSMKIITAIVKRQNNKGTILYWRVD